MMKLVLFFMCLTLPTLLVAQNSEINFGKTTNKNVIKEWIGSIYKISNIDSTTYIAKKSGGKDLLHRYGHRDVIVWIPGSTDLTKDFIVVFWFHGHWGYVPHRTFQDRTLKQFLPYAQSNEKSKNFVIVIPEMPWSIHTSTPTKRNSKVWLKSGDFMKFVDQIEGIMITHNNGVRLAKIDYKIIGHSAGGSVIKRLGITGDLCKLNPSMVIWSDSSYGRWLDNAWDKCLKDTNIKVKVFVYKGGPPFLNATRFLGQFQDPSTNIELHVMGKGWSHKLIGNNVVKLSGILD